MSGPFKMKNTALKMSAKTGSPMQANYASPAKQGFKQGLKEVGEGFKVIGHTLTPSIENIKQAGSNIKEGFRQLFTGDRKDSRVKTEIKSDQDTTKSQEDTKDKAQGNTLNQVNINQK